MCPWGGASGGVLGHSSALAEVFPALRPCSALEALMSAGLGRARRS